MEAITFKDRLRDKNTWLYVGLACALGALAAFAGGRILLKPMRQLTVVRYQSHQGLMRLYELQVGYRAAHGTYANDLETLLASAPDGAQVRERLRTSVDLNTLAVVGDANRFRLEANVLDPDRTSVKIRGPGR